MLNTRILGTFEALDLDCIPTSPCSARELEMVILGTGLVMDVCIDEH